MTELISVSRMFEAYQRAMETFREADRKIVAVPQT
jgi:flagellar basal body rod protein FlgG